MCGRLMPAQLAACLDLGLDLGLDPGKIV